MGKRPRQIGAVVDEREEDVVAATAVSGGSESDEEPAQEQQQQAKRRRHAGFGLGIFSELVGKVYRATTSVFGRGGAER